MASRLSQMQARFQQKQMQEKEEKLLRLYENQQQRTIDRVNRGSAESTTSITSVTSLTSTQGGKVRQMFDERRQKAGIDRSYPLEPLRTVSNKTVVSKTNLQVKNGKPLVSKRDIVLTQYSNNNGNEYYEERRYDNNNEVSLSNHKPLLNKTYKARDLETLMNNHHICDNLDDEEFPDLGIDDIDESVVEPPSLENKTPSLENNAQSLEKKPPSLGKKPPFRNDTINNIKGQKSTMGNCNASPVRSNVTPKKEVKPTVRKTVVQTKSPKTVSTVSSPARTPEKVAPVKMSSKSTGQSTRTPSASRSNKSASTPTPSVVSRDNLQECRYCSRRFAADRLVIHEDICAKTGRKKRKIYDAIKHRVQGTELEPYTRKINKPASNKQKQASTKKSDWRRKHEEFISAIRAAKMAQDHVAKGGKLSDLPPPPPSYNPDYVQCPHCGRRFNEAAAARHIPKCATYDYNKPKPRPGQGSKNTYR